MNDDPGTEVRILPALLAPEQAQDLQEEAASRMERAEEICSDVPNDGTIGGEILVIPDATAVCDVGDPFDPRNWDRIAADSNVREWRIYLDDRAETWAVVDEIDYHWAIRWRWSINKPHPKRKGTKKYARRSQSNGRRYRTPLYLHVEIKKRATPKRPSRLHTQADHKDGDEFNCRRKNLFWSTPKSNARNRADVRLARRKRQRKRK